MTGGGVVEDLALKTVTGPVVELGKWAYKKIESAPSKWDAAAHEIIRTMNTVEHAKKMTSEHGADYTKEEVHRRAWQGGRNEMALEMHAKNIKARPAGIRSGWSFNASRAVIGTRCGRYSRTAGLPRIGSHSPPKFRRRGTSRCMMAWM